MAKLSPSPKTSKRPTNLEHRKVPYTTLWTKETSTRINCSYCNISQKMISISDKKCVNGSMITLNKTKIFYMTFCSQTKPNFKGKKKVTNRSSDTGRKTIHIGSWEASSKIWGNSDVEWHLGYRSHYSISFHWLCDWRTLFAGPKAYVNARVWYPWRYTRTAHGRRCPAIPSAPISSLTRSNTLQVRTGRASSKFSTIKST
jgi:hypothetical protein